MTLYSVEYLKMEANGHVIPIRHLGDDKDALKAKIVEELGLESVVWNAVPKSPLVELEIYPIPAESGSCIRIYVSTSRLQVVCLFVQVNEKGVTEELFQHAFVVDSTVEAKEKVTRAYKTLGVELDWHEGEACHPNSVIEATQKDERGYGAFIKVFPVQTGF